MLDKMQKCKVIMKMIMRRLFAWLVTLNDLIAVNQ